MASVQYYLPSIKHVGSTSLIGIKAKPIIDLVVGIDDHIYDECLLDVIEKLSDIGYTISDGLISYLPNRRVLWKGTSKIHTHHVHLTKKGSEDWNDLILFRDYLLSNSLARKAYEKEKIKIANKYKTNVSRYTSCKEEVYKELLQMAKEQKE